MDADRDGKVGEKEFSVLIDEGKVYNLCYEDALRDPE